MTNTIVDNLWQYWAYYSLIVEATNDARDNRITGIKSFVGGESLDKYNNVPKEF